MKLTGLPFMSARGSTEAENENLKFFQASVIPTSEHLHALNTVTQGAFWVQQLAVVEIGSTNNVINLTAHTARVGDLIHFTDPLFAEYEVSIIEIIDANSFRLAGYLTAAPSVGDTFDILRHVFNRLNADGSMVANISSSPISFNLDGSVVEVTEDTVTPANNLPLPVKLTNLAGDINITAGDLNVQLSHTGGTFDSIQIGNGTNLWAINATLEGLVHDTDVLAELVLIDAKLPATLGAKLAAASLAVVLATNQPALPLSDDAATETKQDAEIVLLTALDDKDFSTETTLAAMSAKLDVRLPATLGQKADTASLAVTQSVEDEAIQVSIAVDNATVAGAVDGTEMQVDIVDAGPLLTEATFQSEADAAEALLTSMEGKTAGSLVPELHDEITLTYRTTGNGIGEIDTVVYELAAATVATLTLAYDANDKLSSVVRT